jgi:hypothetical protein
VWPDVESPPADEELTSGSKRPWLALGLLAAVLVAGLLVARLAESDHPTPVASASTASTPPPYRDAYALPANRGRDCPAADDGQTICTTSPRVPAAVLAAVRARFPHARSVDAVEERLRDVGFGPGGVWYRALSTVDGESSIEVVVRRRTADDRPPFDRGSGGYADRMQVTRLVGRRAVVVTVIAPHGDLPTFRVVRALARDPRLLAASGT